MDLQVHFTRDQCNAQGSRGTSQGKTCFSQQSYLAVVPLLRSESQRLWDLSLLTQRIDGLRALHAISLTIKSRPRASAIEDLT